VVQALGKLDGCSQQSLCLIPARAGSKGLPGKNTREFHGISLLSWTVESAIASRVFNEIAVTTDDPEVKKIAKSFGVTVLDRPIEVAQDASLASDYLKYHSQLIKKFEFMMLLQVTSPLRNTHDIQESFRVLTESNDEDTVLITLTKDLFRVNGAIFAAKTLTLENLEYEFLKGKVKAYIMPQERSVDIDTLMDFNRAKDLFDVERKN